MCVGSEAPREELQCRSMSDTACFGPGLPDRSYMAILGW